MNILARKLHTGFENFVFISYKKLKDFRQKDLLYTLNALERDRLKDKTILEERLFQSLFTN